MKILHVHDFFAPGNSRFAFDMDRLLAARGHEVHVLAAVGELGPADGAVIEGVTFHTYAHKPELPGSRRLAYSNEMNGSYFGKIHQRYHFDILVLNQPLCAMGVCDHPASKPVPKVYWFISPWAAEWKVSNPDAHFVSRLFNTSLRNRMEDLALQQCDAVFVESDFIRRELKAHHRKCPDAKVTLIPGAVDLEKFRPDGSREQNRARFGIGPGPVALTVRRHVERMGIDLLIRAAAEVPGLQLVIGGDGPQRGEFEALARSLNVAAKFLGYVKDEDLPALYRAADLFVLPTRALEGFGLVAIEAMACGTPAMGTPVGAIPEVLGPLKLVFDDVTPQAIAGGIRRFLAEKDGGLPERCRAHVAANYDWAKVIAKAEAVLQQVAKTHKRQRVIFGHGGCLKVLVTDAANRVALAVVRALGRAGATVAAVEQERFAQKTPAAFRSRFVSRYDVVPTLTEDGRFIDALADRAAGYDVVLPLGTNVALKVAAHRDRFQARIPIPPLMTLRRANDKSSALAVARKVGVPIPATYSPEDDEELDDVVARVKKPAVVKLRDDAGTVLEPAQRYAIGRSADELRAAYRRLHALVPFPLIQEKVEGPGYGVGVLAAEGRVLASVAHRRVREYPVSGGPSTICETVVDPVLTGHAAAVIRELGWSGVAMVEFKKDDQYRLMEVNPRFWGSLPLATRAGVNFPDLLCRLAMGETVTAPACEPGIRLRFLLRDAAAALNALRDPERRWTYPAGFVRDLLDPRVADGIVDFGDLEASLVYLANLLP